MNLFKKATASVALVALVSGVFTTGASAYSTAEVEAANMLASKGIINTQADVANYNLGQNVLRQEIAKVAAVMAGIEAKTSCDNSFADVTATTPNTWACSYVEALLDAGKVSANENFRPEDNISKSEAVKMILEAAGYTGIYTDAAKWQEEVVAFAEENGVTTSFSNYNTPATRGFIFEAAANAVTNNEEDDSDDILGDILGDLDEDTEDNTDEDETETPVVSIDGELVVELSPETPNSGFVAGGRARTEILAFDVTAGSEDVVLKNATLEYVGLSNSNDLDVLAMYIDNEKVTKGDSKDFDDNESELTFESETVIKAGETKTVFVTAKIKVPENNVYHKVSLTDLEASTSVELGNIVSDSFTVVNSANVATLKVDVDEESSDVTIGEVETLANFSLEEINDKEDVELKAFTIEFDGFDAEDDLTDLVLYADGEEIDVNLEVNGDDEVVFNSDFIIEQDEKIDFELKGVINGSLADTFTAEFTDIYAVGAKTGLVAQIDDDKDSSNDFSLSDLDKLSDARKIEGSEINVSFDKSDIDEAAPAAEEILVGTLELTSAGDYTIDSIEVTVENTTNTGAIEDIIDNIDLDGSSSDDETDVETDKAVYEFTDISLSAGETKELELTFDVNDNTALNGTDLKFSVKIIEVTDEDNDETYTEGGTYDLDDILSTNSLKPKTIAVESASFELTASNVTERTLVLGNGIEVVLYKGKINVSDSDDITLDDFVLANSGTLLSGGADLEDVLDEATLNIGGKTFDGDISSTKIEFNSLNAVIAAGSDNVSVLVTAILSDSDDIVSGNTLQMAVDTDELTIEDSEGADLEDDNVTTSSANTYKPLITLNEEGSISIAVVTNGDNDDEIENVVLAGESNIALAEVEIEAENEDIKIEELSFTLTGADFSSTLDNVRLMNGSNVIVDGAVVTYNSTDTLITFKDDFIVEESEDKISALLVADLNIVTTEGGTVSAALGNLNVELVNPGATSSDIKGVSSNEEVAIDITDTEVAETVTVVPALVTASIVNTFGDEDQYAKIKFSIDKGNNDLDNDDVTITEINLEQAVASGVVIRNDDNANITLSGSTNTTKKIILTADNEISNGDEFEFKVTSDNDEVRIIANGISFEIDNKPYKISNDKVIDLGSYTTD